MRPSLTKQGGFTLLELLIVILIIGVLVAIVLAALNVAREKGRDAARKAETQELIKAFELYYTDNNSYPPQSDTTDYYLASMVDALTTGKKYLSRAPEYTEDFKYCVSGGGSSYVLAVNTEDDKGLIGSDYCNVSRGPDPFSSCSLTTLTADDSCATRFQ